MVTDCDLILKNALMPDGNIGDISIKDGYVIHTGSSIRSDKIIDCSGYICLPGAVDMHVHMRGGKEQSYKETWESGSKSAVAGGVTTVVDQPNTIPPIKDAESFEQRVKEAKRNSFCNFGINGGVMPGCNIEEMYKAGALAFGEIFFAESSYGSAVDAEMLSNYLQEISEKNAVATIHAETVTEGADETLISHDRLRNQDGEAEAVNSVLKLAPPDLRLHFCHLSSPKAIEKISGMENISFEVMPHHLFLSIEMFGESDSKGKVNPPLRHERTRKELWAKWDEIDVVASDHAPHILTEKINREFSSIPSGLPGVETMLPILMAMALNGEISIQSIVEKTVNKPSEILGIEYSGFTTGCRGDFALYPKETSIIDSDMLHSNAGWTPYEGMKAVFPEIVIIGGNTTFKRGEFLKGTGRWIKGDGYIGDNSE